MVGKCVFDFIGFIWRLLRLYVLPKYAAFRVNLKKMFGTWAVVTGATNGIGKAIAKQLAKRGINLVLISRSEEKLKATAQEIGNGVDIRTIVYDFTTSAGYDVIRQQLKDVDVGILVNNVGVSYKHAEFYGDWDPQACDDMIKVNIHSVLKMTRVVLDGMVSRKIGLLVHISSASGYAPFPLYSVYSGTKSFVNNFAESLHHEYAHKGIQSQFITPSFVSTNMTRNMKPNGFSVADVDHMAQQTVNAFGLSSCLYGHWGHELIVTSLFKLLPRSYCCKKTLEFTTKVREAYMRRMANK